MYDDSVELAQWLRAMEPSVQEMARWLRRNAPSERGRQRLIEQTRQLRDSSQFRQHMAQLNELTRQLREWRPAPSEKKKRMPGAGRPRSLDDETKMEMQQAYREACARNPTLKQQGAAVEWLTKRQPRRLLRAAAQRVSPGTLVRHVIRPVKDQNKLEDSK